MFIVRVCFGIILGLKCIFGVVSQISEMPGCLTKVVPVVGAWQSSTSPSPKWLDKIASMGGYSAYAAENAVDGDFTTNSVLGRCTQTSQERSPWWQAQLDASYYFTVIKVTSSSDGELTTRNLLVEVADMPSSFDDRNWNGKWQSSKRSCDFNSGDLSSGSVTTLTCSYPLLGNYVRLTMVTDEDTTLSLCEVEIEGIEASCMMTTRSEVVSALAVATLSNLTILATTDAPAVATSSNPPILATTDSPAVATLSNSPILATTDAPAVATSSNPPILTTTDAPAVATSSNPPILASTEAPAVATSSNPPILTTTDAPAVTTSSNPPILTTTYSLSTSSSMELTTTAETTRGARISPTSSSYVSVRAPTSEAPSMCPCACSKSVLIAKLLQNNKTVEQVAEEIEESIVEMKVDTKSTSTSQRKLISATDSRHSVKVVGTVGVTFFAVVFGCIILADMPILFGVMKHIIEHIIQTCNKNKEPEHVEASAEESGDVITLSDV